MLNVDEYMANITEKVDNDEMNLKEVQDDIKKQTALEKAILDLIPESIIVSIFKIDIKETRNHLADKRNKIINLEKELIAKKAKQRR